MKVNIPLPCVDPEFVGDSNRPFCLGCSKHVVNWDGESPVQPGQCVIAPGHKTTYKDTFQTKLAKFCLALLMVFGVQLFSTSVSFGQADSTTVNQRSQKTTIIKGQVVDKIQEPVPWSHIVVNKDGEPYTTVETDETGSFKLVLTDYNKESDYELVISAFGYQDKPLGNIDLSTNGYTDLGKLELAWGIDEVHYVIGCFVKEVHIEEFETVPSWTRNRSMTLHEVNNYIRVQ